MPENDQLVRLSKRMSYALRHDPSSFGLSLASDGSVSVSELIDALNRTKNAHYTAADIDAVMSMPGKRRFALENGRIKLKGTGSELLNSDEVRKAYLGG